MDDYISRQAAIDAIGEKSDEIYKTKQKGATYPHDDFFQGMAYAEDVVKRLPPIQPKRGKCKWCERLKERNLRIEYYWIDQEGCTASFSEPHIVATGIANFCPNCGADMREVTE